MTEIYNKGTLAVWFTLDDDDNTATFAGQDLGGYSGSSEYEYWLKVDQSALRRALEIGPDADLMATVVEKAADIVGTGEMTWLKAHDVEYQFNSWVS